MLNLPIPKNAVTVGEIIEEEYRKPLGLTQQQFADALNISRGRYVEIAAGKRGVALDTALRLARVLGTSPQFWIDLQTMYDLSEAAKIPAAAEIAKLKAIIMEPVLSESAVVDAALKRKVASASKEIVLPSIGKDAAMPGRYSASGKKKSVTRRSTKKVIEAKSRTIPSGKRSSSAVDRRTMNGSGANAGDARGDPCSFHVSLPSEPRRCRCSSHFRIAR